MASGKESPIYRNTETADEIREVFERCARRQQQLNPSVYQTLRKLILSELTFSSLQFPRAPDLPADSKGLLIWQGQLYQALLARLKDPDEYWSVLAQWQKYERLRAPEQFLPPDVWRRLTRNASARLRGFPGKKFYHAELVKIWLPYTEPLVRRRKWLRQTRTRTPDKVLQRLGYDSAVVELVLSKGWNSAVEFTCDWVAQKGGSADAETLRNAYSEIFGQRFLRQTKCFICDRPAENEFWVDGDPIFHCAEHGADQLPTSEISAWTDRFGRNWWREDLNIRCTTPAAPV